MVVKQWILVVLLFSGVMQTGCASANFLASYVQGLGKTEMKDVSLRPSRMDDPALEQEMQKAYADAGWKEEVRGITITAPEWTVVRHPVSGEITHRTITADMVVKADGKDYCRFFSVGYKQAYDGANYGVTQYHGTGDTAAVDCEKAVATDN